MGGGSWPRPSFYGPLWTPYEIFLSLNPPAPKARKKILPVSLKQWKRRRRGGGGVPLLLWLSAVLIHPCV